MREMNNSVIVHVWIPILLGREMLLWIDNHYNEYDDVLMWL